MFAKWIILVILTLIPADCLKVKLVIPKLITTGSTVALVCQYDLEGKHLYAVKWYRGNYEFFRYVPGDRPPMTAFPYAGLNVDTLGSSPHQVTLFNVPKHISGNVSCEVSTEENFHTKSDSVHLNVIDLHIRRPILHLSNSSWRKDVPLNINCSAQVTNPPPIIDFYVENIKVDEIYVQNLGPGLAGLSLSALDSKLIDPQYVSPVWVRCEAYLRGVYHKTSASAPIIPQPMPEVSKAPLQCVELFFIICIALVVI